MLIEFAVTNFRSIKNRQVINFQASGSVGKKINPDNLILPKEKSHGGPLISTGVVYGANASGKSNFLKAILALGTMITTSNEYNLDKPIPVYEPFKLDPKSRHEPTIFEIDFIANDGQRYIYQVAFERLRVVREELFFYKTGQKLHRPTLIFSRKAGPQIEFGEYKGKRDFSILENQLILTRAGFENLPTLTEAYRFFSKFLFVGTTQSTMLDDIMLGRIEYIFSNEVFIKYRESIISLVRAADTGISNLYTKDIQSVDVKYVLPHAMRQELINQKRRIKTVHTVFEDGIETGEEVFDLSEESTGTIKLLGLAGIIIDALEIGGVIVLDELDKHLHPLLTRMLIELFQSAATNSTNAQLLFSTHDISLIDKDLFRRDQIFLVDKGTEGVSEMTRLSDFTGISKVVPLEKWYMAGMFRAVPAINKYEITLPKIEQLMYEPN